jgi:hypothetical protein
VLVDVDVAAVVVVAVVVDAIDATWRRRLSLFVSLGVRLIALRCFGGLIMGVIRGVIFCGPKYGRRGRMMSFIAVIMRVGIFCYWLRMLLLTCLCTLDILTIGITRTRTLPPI